MTELTKNQLVAELARDVVAELAPKELPMFQARSSAYFKDPERILKGKSNNDEMLGFGPDAAVIFLTPAILAMATTIVNFVVSVVKDPLQEGFKDILGDSVKSVFEKLHTLQAESASKESERKAKTLTPEQLKLVRKQTIQQARQLGLAERTAETLADSLLGRLAVA